MDLDIHVFLKKFPRELALLLAKRFEVEVLGEELEAPYQDIIVRLSAELQKAVDIDFVIRDFLKSLKAHGEIKRHLGGMLHIGIFYDTNETVVFPLRLSYKTISTLNDLRLGVDATGYPCAEDSEAD